MLKLIRLTAALCRNDLQDRFAGSILGSLWLLIWPIVQMAVYILIFGKLMGARLGQDGHIFSYGIYIASGLLCWTFFANCLSKSCRVFTERRAIIRKVRISLPVLPASVCMGELLPFCAGFLLLALTACYADSVASGGDFLLVICSFYCQLTLAYGLGTFLGCLAVFSRDVIELTNIALQLAFWFTPIVYLPSILPDWLASILWLNPMTSLVRVFQEFFVLGGRIIWPEFIYSAIISQLALGAAIFICRKWNRELRDVM